MDEAKIAALLQAGKFEEALKAVGGSVEALMAFEESMQAQRRFKDKDGSKLEGEQNGSSSAAEGTPSEHGVDKGTGKETPGKDGAK